MRAIEQLSLLIHDDRNVLEQGKFLLTVEIYKLLCKIHTGDMERLAKIYYLEYAQYIKEVIDVPKRMEEKFDNFELTETEMEALCALSLVLKRAKPEEVGKKMCMYYAAQVCKREIDRASSLDLF